MKTFGLFAITATIFACGGARASTDVVDRNAANVEASADGPAYVRELIVTGVFEVPNINSNDHTLSGISATLSGDAGGAVSGTSLRGVQVETTFSVGGQVIEQGQSAPAAVGSTGLGFVDRETGLAVPASALDNHGLNSFTSTTDGTSTEVPFRIVASATGHDVGDAIPLLFEFIKEPSLEITYSLDGIEASAKLVRAFSSANVSASEVPVSDPAQFVVHTDGTFPSDLADQLPAYLAPEPASLAILEIGLVGILAGRNRR